MCDFMFIYIQSVCCAVCLCVRMREVDVGGVGPALLVREGDQFYAIGPKCSHYGAPLAKGNTPNSSLFLTVHCT